jgi:hypothetical protein
MDLGGTDPSVRATHHHEQSIADRLAVRRLIQDQTCDEDKGEAAAGANRDRI